ncbi:MAG: cysteine synthase family protein [Gemmataceae bacterium]|jgi:cysteine synthase A|nr:cysteine synthase family protein [Gemmataceae bacterium]
MSRTLASFPHRYLNRLPVTPLVAVQLESDSPSIWCKLEFLNPSGSTKDRIARYILEKAWRLGKIGPETTVVEASSGSTSIALALACAQYGLRFIAVMPEGVSHERVMIIRAYGGQVKLTPKELGIRGAIQETERMAQDPTIFLPQQFSNLDNAEAHRLGTAREILDQIPCGTVDAVVSGVGTGGTLVGLYQGFLESGCAVIPVLARPVNATHPQEVECCSFGQSPVTINPPSNSGATQGSERAFSARIPGVVDSLSTIFRDAKLPNLMTIEVDDSQAIHTTKRLLAKGFPVGPSSGLNFVAALECAKRVGKPNPQIVTVFPDRMERYFTTELFRDV